jgi:excisionase family DNA binding protein
LAAALIPRPRQPEPPAAKEPDFLTAAQLAARLGVSRETVRRLAIAGALPHTVVCRGARKTTRRFPRRFADEFAASGLSRMTVTRIVRRGNRGTRAEPDRLASQTPPSRGGGR